MATARTTTTRPPARATAPRPTAARRPAAAKRPADRKPKAQKAGPDQPYVFTRAGKSFEIPPIIDHLDAGFVRRSRKLPMVDQLFTLLELVLEEDDPALAAIDAMGLEELGEFSDGWAAHIGISLGE